MTLKVVDMENSRRKHCTDSWSFFIWSSSILSLHTDHFSLPVSCGSRCFPIEQPLFGNRYPPSDANFKCTCVVSAFDPRLLTNFWKRTSFFAPNVTNPGCLGRRWLATPTLWGNSRRCSQHSKFELDAVASLGKWTETASVLEKWRDSRSARRSTHLWDWGTETYQQRGRRVWDNVYLQWYPKCLVS